MRFAFISTLLGRPWPWGGSEELWSRSAIYLTEQGNGVSVSLHGWAPQDPNIERLRKHGLQVYLRVEHHPVARRALRILVRDRTDLGLAEYGRFLSKNTPELVVISDCNALPPIDLLELCALRGLPFVCISQVNREGWWPSDSLADRYRSALAAAARCFFVSEANWRLAERQISGSISNAEIVRNPFNVPFNAAPMWPTPEPEEELRLACVARLDPSAKGQDLLFQALATPQWRSREWLLSLYGEGPVSKGLMWLANSFGLADHVRLVGHVPDVIGIWAEHHALVLPSRFEGMPLALVEAMLCGRPAIATDVAGHREIIEDGVTGFLAEAPSVPALQRTLERAWKRRAKLRSMGEAASRRIRLLVPEDPVLVFSERLKACAAAANAAKGASFRGCEGFQRDNHRLTSVY